MMFYACSLSLFFVKVNTFRSTLVRCYPTELKKCNESMKNFWCDMQLWKTFVSFLLRVNDLKLIIEEEHRVIKTSDCFCAHPQG